MPWYQYPATPEPYIIVAVVVVAVFLAPVAAVAVFDQWVSLMALFCEAWHALHVLKTKLRKMFFSWPRRAR